MRFHSKGAEKSHVVPGVAVGISKRELGKITATTEFNILLKDPMWATIVGYNVAQRREFHA